MDWIGFAWSGQELFPGGPAERRIAMKIHRRLRETLLSLLILSTCWSAGLSDDPTNGDAHVSVKSNSGLNVMIICFAILAVVGIATVLYKKWQKKKREEQHARLLKLFEEDDDLEAELGLRDEF